MSQDHVVIDGDISLLKQFDGDMELIICTDGEYGVVTEVSNGDIPSYTGETVVNPDFVGITLETAHKIVPSDIIVNPIQVESVSDLHGGRVVYIGGII